MCSSLARQPKQPEAASRYFQYLLAAINVNYSDRIHYNTALAQEVTSAANANTHLGRRELSTHTISGTWRSFDRCDYLQSSRVATLTYSLVIQPRFGTNATWCSVKRATRCRSLLSQDHKPVSF
jgi:hypothetical protein